MRRLAGFVALVGIAFAVASCVPTRPATQHAPVAVEVTDEQAILLTFPACANDSVRLSGPVLVDEQGNQATDFWQSHVRYGSTGLQTVDVSISGDELRIDWDGSFARVDGAEQLAVANLREIDRWQHRTLHTWVSLKFGLLRELEPGIYVQPAELVDGGSDALSLESISEPEVAPLFAAFCDRIATAD